MVFTIKLYLRDLNQSFVNMAKRISTYASHTVVLEFPVQQLVKIRAGTK